jgi:hypothetical protein
LTVPPQLSSPRSQRHLPTCKDGSCPRLRSSPGVPLVSDSRSQACCATRGFELTLAARTGEKVEAAGRELDGLAVQADVADESDCRRIVEEHRRRYERLDVLIPHVVIERIEAGGVGA